LKNPKRDWKREIQTYIPFELLELAKDEDLNKGK
jgi:hypothetical protein